MTLRPLVSVIIPTFNRERYISEAIESVINQSYKNLEIVVVDDGSTDNTYDIIKKYTLWYNVKYLFQNRKGPAAARNAGSRCASGDYIAFLDSDDLWLETKIEKQMDIMLKNNEVGLVYTNCSNWNMDNNTYKVRYSRVYSGNLYKKLLFRKCSIVPSTMLLSKEIFHRCGGFDESLIRSEDREFAIRVARNIEIVGIDEPLTIIRLHTLKNNLKDPNDLFDYSVTIHCEQKLLNKIFKIEHNKILQYRLFSRYYFVWACGYRHACDYKNFYEYLLKSVCYNPLNFRSWLNFFIRI